ncbi:hypothetical protein JOL79_02995 [Microbispora sp. RL4-1S]|uniref:Acyl-CoA dehydrogenase n=1 Tax=Microbispora oryzae TaxID=2806554 RepID=A0A940WHD7_9ACTN|nr:hypothetical protein [Microbispora oryzae]MBP2702768.1 hypothetical protein [Microbispora oryzae]
MTTEIGARLRAAAREDGLVAALRLLNEETGGGALAHGPAGHAVAPVAPAAPAGGTATVVRTIELHGDTLVALRDPQGRRARPAWSLGLLWLRLGLSEALLDHCLAYLGERTSGDTPLLLQQMVKGQLAEAVTDHLEIETLLAGTEPDDLGDDTAAWLHERVTRADRTLLRLLGGSGFRADGPGATADVSELLADAYAGRDRTEEVNR